jgi:hypothetical protein
MGEVLGTRDGRDIGGPVTPSPDPETSTRDQPELVTPSTHRRDAVLSSLVIFWRLSRNLNQHMDGGFHSVAQLREEGALRVAAEGLICPWSILSMLDANAIPRFVDIERSGTSPPHVTSSMLLYLPCNLPRPELTMGDG